MGFFDGGAKGASFDETQGYALGTVWSGVIAKVGEPKQATSYVPPNSNETPKPLFFPSGDPIMELPIEIQAEQVTPSSEDDGIRVIFFGGEKKKALGLALRAAGVRRDPQPGDHIALRWSGNGGPTGRRKLYEAKFTAGDGAFFAEQAPAAPVAPVAPAPVPQAAQVAATLQQAAAQTAPQPPVAPAAPQPAPTAPAAQEARPPWQAAPQPAQVGAGSEEPPW